MKITKSEIENLIDQLDHINDIASDIVDEIYQIKRGLNSMIKLDKKEAGKV